MSDLEAQFNDRSSVFSAERQAVELDGINAARSGVDNGFNAGHLAALGADALPINKRDKGADDAIDIILSTLPYSEMLSQTYQKLNEAEISVEQLIERAAERFAVANNAVEHLRDKAAQTADGTRVARSEKSGLVYDIETGREISETDAATIIWSGDEPSLETIDAQREQADAALHVLERAHGYESQLGSLREELSEKPDRERLDTLQNEIDAIQAATDADLANLETSHGQTLEVQPQTLSLDVPEL